ncbi:MAG: glycosyltransferase [Actinomycetota bacterium]|nr:MAG: glycosyltransferase [Actinomycetota bacterium]
MTAPSTTAGPLVEVTIPVLNEEIALAPCVERLQTYLARQLPYRFRIVVADNGSTDATALVAAALAARYPEVRYVRLAERGRGRALRSVWSASDADVLAYMDVDLSTDLAAFLPLVAGLVSGHSDVAVGSRLAAGSRVDRGPLREVLSRGYNLILRTTLGLATSDAQCGFKACSARAARVLLPLVRDDGWFFDTELLVLAERHGMRVHEVPVDWHDDPDSRVEVARTVAADLAGVLRLWRTSGVVSAAAALRPPPAPSRAGQVLRFAAVGVASTVVYLVLFAGLAPLLPAVWANGVALAVSAVFNTGANRRVTFGVAGREGRVAHHAAGLVLFGGALAITTGSLWLLALADPSASTALQLVVLVVANAACTVGRFLVLRNWVFARRGRSGGAAGPAPTSAVTLPVTTPAVTSPVTTPAAAHTSRQAVG